MMANHPDKDGLLDLPRPAAVIDLTGPEVIDITSLGDSDDDMLDEDILDSDLLDAERSFVLRRLPPEVMEEVANHGPAQDLASLRLACREMNDKVIRAFTKECFTDMTFLVQFRRSMQVLETVSEHPIFSKSLKRVRLSLQCLPNDETDDWQRKESANAKGQYMADAVFVGRRQDQLNQENDIMLEQKKSYRRLLAEQDKFKWKRSLLQSLSNLKAHGGIALEIISTGGPRPCGKKAVQRLLGYKKCLEYFGRGRHSSAIHSLRPALNSTIPLSKLKIEIYPDDFRIIVQKERERPDSGLRSLHTLDLTLLFYNKDYGVIGDLDGFLAIMPGLVDLKISMEKRRRPKLNVPGFFAHILRSVSMPGLRSANIDLPMYLRELIEFIKQYRETLRQVTVHEDRFVDQTSPSMENLEKDIAAAAAGTENLTLRIMPSRKRR